MNDFDKFNTAMDTILKAKPADIKAAMEADKEKRAEQRKRKKVGNDRTSKNND